MARYYPVPELLKPTAEVIGHTPAHYDFAIEPLNAIHAWGLNFARGNVVKYVARAARKGTELEDLRKARDYLNFEIERLERKP